MRPESDGVVGGDWAYGQAFEQASLECDRLHPDPASYEAVEPLLNSYLTQVLSNDTIEAARSRWSTCMSQEGYPEVTSVSDLVNDLFPIKEMMVRASLSRSEKRRFDAATLEQEVPAAEAIILCDERELFPVMDAWMRLEPSWLDDNAQMIS